MSVGNDKIGLRTLGPAKAARRGLMSRQFCVGVKYSMASFHRVVNAGQLSPHDWGLLHPHEFRLPPVSLQYTRPTQLDFSAKFKVSKAYTQTSKG